MCLMETQLKYRMAGNNHNGLSLTDGCNNSGSIHSFALRISNSCKSLFNATILRTFVALLVCLVSAEEVKATLPTSVTPGSISGAVSTFSLSGSAYGYYDIKMTDGTLQIPHGHVGVCTA